MTTTGGRPHWGPFVALVALVVALDQATKLWIANELSGGRVIVYFEGALRLVYSKNSGALFGLFSGQVLIFGLLSLAVIGLIVMFHARAGRNPYMTLTLGLLLGGAIGNAIDRFRLGYVIDFVDGGLGTTRFFTFNGADAAISAAIVLLVAMAIWPKLAGGTVGTAGVGDGAEAENPTAVSERSFVDPASDGETGGAGG